MWKKIIPEKKKKKEKRKKKKEKKNEWKNVNKKWVKFPSFPFPSYCTLDFLFWCEPRLWVLVKSFKRFTITEPFFQLFSNFFQYFLFHQFLLSIICTMTFVSLVSITSNIFNIFVGFVFSLIIICNHFPAGIFLSCFFMSFHFECFYNLLLITLISIYRCTYLVV